MTARLSGVQRDVLSLYRRILREAVSKDRESSEAMAKSFLTLLSGDESNATSTSYAAAEFRRQAASVKRLDFKRIEYMIRKGDKQVKLLRMPHVKIVGGTA
jgi:hypothetical protein